MNASGKETQLTVAVADQAQATIDDCSRIPCCNTGLIQIDRIPVNDRKNPQRATVKIQGRVTASPMQGRGQQDEVI